MSRPGDAGAHRLKGPPRWPESRTVSAPTKTPGRLRPLPVRNDDLAHLDLPGLRVYRSALSTEENRVSYWRRIIQARLDLLRAADAEGGEPVRLAERVLSGPTVASGRRALLAIVPRDDMPPLPELDELWRTVARRDDPRQLARLQAALAEAERALSAYRAALHRRMDAATSELIARYREDPAACLSVLPREREPALRAHG